MARPVVTVLADLRAAHAERKAAEKELNSTSTMISNARIHAQETQARIMELERELHLSLFSE